MPQAISMKNKISSWICPQILLEVQVETWNQEQGPVAVGVGVGVACHQDAFKQVSNKGHFEINAPCCLQESSAWVRNVQRSLWKEKKATKPTFQLPCGEQGWERAFPPRGASVSTEIKLLSHFLPHNYLVGFLLCKNFLLSKSSATFIFPFSPPLWQGWESRCH